MEENVIPGSGAVDVPLPSRCWQETVRLKRHNAVGFVVTEKSIIFCVCFGDVACILKHYLQYSALHTVLVSYDIVIRFSHLFECDMTNKCSHCINTMRVILNGRQKLY